MNKKIIWVVVAIVIVILIVVFSRKGSSTEPVSNTGAVKIGAIISETGVAASFGEMSHKGIELAAKEINALGGVNGRQVVIVFEDDQTDPKAAAGAFHKLTGIDGVQAVIGSNFDFVTQPLFSLAKDNGTVVMSPSNPRIPGAFDTNSHSFVMMTDFSDIIRTFKSYLEAVDYKQLGMLRFESSFGESIEDTLDDMQKELGKKPLVVETYKEIGNNDFRTQILKLKQAGVDMIFLDMVSIDPVTFVTQASQLGYKPKIITHDGIKDSLYMKDVNAKPFEGAVSINWNVNTEDFVKRFAAEYGVNPDKSANRAYDAVYVLAEAISKAKDKSEIPSILETITFTTPNGIFGFNKNHAAATTEVAIETVKNGKLVPWKK